MKSFGTILIVAIIGSAIQCDSIQNRITELHHLNLEKGNAFEPDLEQLVQQSNSINVQGRPLTSEEIEFTEKVSGLASGFDTWKEDMERIEDRPMDEERLEIEQMLQETIDSLARIAVRIKQTE